LPSVSFQSATSFRQVRIPPSSEPTLFAIDLDDTVVHTDAIMTRAFLQAQRRGLAHEAAQLYGQRTWAWTLAHGPDLLTDAFIPQWMVRARAANHTLVALTARSGQCAQDTHAQMRRLGLPLSQCVVPGLTPAHTIPAVFFSRGKGDVLIDKGRALLNIWRYRSSLTGVSEAAGDTAGTVNDTATEGTRSGTGSGAGSVPWRRLVVVDNDWQNIVDLAAAASRLPFEAVDMYHFAAAPLMEA
jgi:hypothetical protein